jgi:hypothetical protein
VAEPSDGRHDGPVAPVIRQLEDRDHEAVVALSLRA